MPLRVQIELHAPLLYWADRRQWMWHKKWALPTITVRVQRLGPPSPAAAFADDRLYVHLTAGTMRDDGAMLEHQGVSGDSQRLCHLGYQGVGEVSFSRLLFMQTSFNCGNRPFHLVVTLLAAPPRTAGESATPMAMGATGVGVAAAPPPTPTGGADGSHAQPMSCNGSHAQPIAVEATALPMPDDGTASANGTQPPSQQQQQPPPPPPPPSQPPLKPLACFCSSAVRVDARKRSKGERPEASADDVRLVSRQRPSACPAAAPATVGGSAAQAQGVGVGVGVGGAAAAAAAAGGIGVAAAMNGQMVGEGAAHHHPHPHPATHPATHPAIDPRLTDGDGGSDLRFSARSLMDATSDAMVELRPDGVVVQVLSSSAFGYTPAQLLGRSILTICYTDEHPALLQTMQALLMLNVRAQAGADAASARPGLMMPRTVRMLHRVIVGLGGPRTAEPVAVDSILSIAAPNRIGGQAQTLLLCARRALPVGPGPTDPSFAFQIFPWPS